MKLNQRQITLSFTGIALGLALSITGSLIRKDLHTFSVILIVLGIMIVMSAIVYVIYTSMGSKRLDDIERKDERNTIIRDKAGAFANTVIIVLLSVVGFVLLVFDIEPTIGQILTGVALLDTLIFTLSARYYNKEL